MTQRYAIIENGLVVNVVIASEEVAQADWVRTDVAGPGYTYSDGVFLAPPPVTPEPPPTKNMLLAIVQDLQNQIALLKD